MESKELRTNKIDILASAVKSVVGAVPVAGSFLTELVSNIIPNQRVDRLTKYVEILNVKLSKIELDQKERVKENEEFIDLFEEGFVQASRALSDDRREYIASIISNGIDDTKIKFEESKAILKLLQELNDIEIIWLRFYYKTHLNANKDFEETHKNILKVSRRRIPTKTNEEAISKQTIQQNYKDHLERLKLIENSYKINKNSGLPEFNHLSGTQKVASTHITTLGKLLLKQIGLIPSLSHY